MVRHLQQSRGFESNNYSAFQRCGRHSNKEFQGVGFKHSLITVYHCFPLVPQSTYCLPSFNCSLKYGFCKSVHHHQVFYFWSTCSSLPQNPTLEISHGYFILRLHLPLFPKILPLKSLMGISFFIYLFPQNPTLEISHWFFILHLPLLLFPKILPFKSLTGISFFIYLFPKILLLKSLTGISFFIYLFLSSTKFYP